MKNAAIKILTYILLAAGGVATGWGGSYAVNWAIQSAGTPPAEEAVAAPQPSIDAVQLRVRGGQMEWFDGARWNAAASVEELRQSDPAEAKSDTWNALAQQRAAAKEQQRQESLAQFDREQSALSTGEKPVVRQPTQARRPTTTQTTTPPPAATPDPTPPPPAQEPEWTGDYE